MRMRHKKHLEERIAAASAVLAAREGFDFYETDEKRRKQVLDLKELFGNDNPVCLEIGCGKGDFAIESAKLHPDVNYIAVEKLSNVIVEACEKATKQHLPNLRFVNCSAENLLYFLPEKCVAEIDLNFSCPFPKKTYANRRLTYKNYLELYKKLLTDDGIICQKTDNVDFFEFSLASYEENGFETFDVTRDLHSENRPTVVTEYERKFLAMGLPICACKAKRK